MKSRLAIIGAGFSGLAASVAAAEAGWEVDVYEKHSIAGGRARQFSEQGFRFDMGPSWYWMPDVIEGEFKQYGHTTADFFELQRLNPSYQVFWADEAPLEVPADIDQLADWLESREPGASRQLDSFLEEARQKYHLGMWNLARQSRPKLRHLLQPGMLKNYFTLDLISSMQKHIRRYFSDPKIQMLLSFPVLFIGGSPRHLPSLYSLMNYADMKLGSWYPMGGMHQLVAAWQKMAEQRGVRFHFDTEIERIELQASRVDALHSNGLKYGADALVATGDYHHVEQELLSEEFRQYNTRYWENRTMAPSCLIYYCGLECKLPGLTHHNLFFDEDMEQHTTAIYDQPSWPNRPLFYACCPSKTDPNVAPEGMENLFLLMPVAPGLDDSALLHDHYFELIEQRLQKHIGIKLSDHLTFKRSYGIRDFRDDYHAYKGNAYGMANTLRQTSIFKPSMKHPKISNMFYAGQLTQPGPGVPPCLMSGRMAVEQLNSESTI